MNSHLRIKLILAVVATLLAGCAGGPPKLPYPAFIQVDELEDMFMASLPGVRAKQLSGDPQTRRTSNRVDLPKDWRGTSGGSPGRSLEIFVIDGELSVADVSLTSGGYAYLPAGSLGFNLTADEGARILYFVSDTDPDAVIRSPIIINSSLLDWQPTAKLGVSSKELRSDPGSGAKTWLVRVSTGAESWQYAPGGYFYRPANTISGGPESFALTDSIWVLRETSHGNVSQWPSCVVQKTD